MDSLKVNNHAGHPGDSASAFDRIGLDRSVVGEETCWDRVGKGREGIDVAAAAGTLTRKPPRALPAQEMLCTRNECTVSAMVRGDRISPHNEWHKPQKKTHDGSDLSDLIESMWRCTLSGDFDVDAKPKGANMKRSEDSEKERTVRFSVVEIREYGLIASHNPGGSAGVPVELSWEYSTLGRARIDAFEGTRSPERIAKFVEEGRLTRLEREAILLRLGATRKEIREAARTAALSRGRRRRSVCTMQHDQIYEGAERGLDALRGVFGALRRRARRLRPAVGRKGYDSKAIESSFDVRVG